MDCHYFDAGRCRSCRLMGVPYPAQLARKQAAALTALAVVAPGVHWADPFASKESGYRNKAKWVVGGRRGRPTIGILDEHKEGIDLRECGICEPALRASFPVLADFIAQTGLVPYDIGRRSGQLKYLIVTASPDGELMVRFVVRSPGDVEQVTRRLPDLQAALPRSVVVSVNIHPEHKAVIEGDTEIVLTARGSLPMTLNDVTMYLGPQAFFQTNSMVAAGLYRQAADWVTDIQPGSILDLYCGVGGFALHCASAGVRRITGVEVSPTAIRNARRSAADLPDPGRFTFEVADATGQVNLDADLIVVNPPRRGIGTLATQLEQDGNVRHVVYSSCNVHTLASDLAAMPSSPAAASAPVRHVPADRPCRGRGAARAGAENSIRRSPYRSRAGVDRSCPAIPDRRS